MDSDFFCLSSKSNWELVQELNDYSFAVFTYLV